DLTTEGRIAAVDTITDYKSGDDSLVVFDLWEFASEDLEGIGTIEGGVVSFVTGFLAGKILDDVVNALDSVLDWGEGVLFDFDGDAYLFVSGDGVAAEASGDDPAFVPTLANDSLIK